MRLVNAKNPTAVDFIQPYLLGSEDFSVDDVAEILRQYLSKAPEDILFLIAAEEPEEDDLDQNPKVYAYSIAISEPHKNHVFIVQAWVDPQIEDRNLSKKLFYKTVLWAQQKGKTELRMETSRDTQGYERKFQFTELSRIMKYDIPEDLEERLFEVKDSNDGSRKQTEHRADIDSDEKSKDSGGHHGESTVGGTSQRSNTVPRDASSSSDTGSADSKRESYGSGTESKSSKSTA